MNLCGTKIIKMTITLQLPTYQFWYDAIASDNIKTIKDVLEALDSKEQIYKLIHGRFTRPKKFYNNFNNIEKISTDCFVVETPFCLAMAYGANDTILEFMDHGVDVAIQDHSGNNCVHVLIITAFFKPEDEEKLRKTFCMFQQNICNGLLKELLMQENDSGFRPLELAADLAVFGFFQDIFESPVYITNELHDGICTTQLFDITEYESATLGTRASRSPLTMLSLLDLGSACKPHIEEVFEAEYMRKWFKQRFWKSIPSVCVYALLRILLLLNYLFFDIAFISREDTIAHSQKSMSKSFENSTESYCLATLYKGEVPSETIMLCLAACLLFHCLKAILSHARSAWKHREKLKVIKYLQNSELNCTDKRLFIGYLSYSTMQFVLYILIICDIVIRLLRYYHFIRLPIFVTSSLHVFTLFYLTTSVVSFLSMWPGFGQFMLTMEKGAHAFFKQFWIIYALMVLPYFQVFVRLSNLGQSECNKDFNSFGSTLYTIFLLSFNMMDFTDYDHLPGDQAFALHAAHTEFILTIALLLMNYCIAMFSYYVSDVLEKGYVITKVQTIYLLNQYDITDCIPSWKRILTKLEKRIFITDKSGRIYISRNKVAKDIKKCNAVVTNPNKNQATTLEKIKSPWEDLKHSKAFTLMQRSLGAWRGSKHGEIDSETEADQTWAN